MRTNRQQKSYKTSLLRKRLLMSLLNTSRELSVPIGSSCLFPEVSGKFRVAVEVLLRWLGLRFAGNKLLSFAVIPSALLLTVELLANCQVRPSDTGFPYLEALPASRSAIL